MRYVSLGPTMTQQPGTRSRIVHTMRDRPLAWIRRHHKEEYLQRLRNFLRRFLTEPKLMAPLVCDSGSSAIRINLSNSLPNDF